MVATHHLSLLSWHRIQVCVTHGIAHGGGAGCLRHGGAVEVGD